MFVCFYLSLMFAFRFDVFGGLWVLVVGFVGLVSFGFMCWFALVWFVVMFFGVY